MSDGWTLQQKPPMGWPLDPTSTLIPTAGWSMLEGSGNKVFDLSGNGYHLTSVNGPTWVPGKFGVATHYVAASQQYFTRDCSPVTSMKYSVVSWIKAGEDNPAADRFWFYFGDSGDGGDWFSLNFNTSGQIRAWERTNGTTVTTAADYADGNYHQVVATLEYTTGPLLKLYVDGIFIGEHQDTGADDTPSYDRITIGRLGDLSPSGYFEGDIDHVTMYNRALSASEIALLYRYPFYMYQNQDALALFYGPGVIGNLSVSVFDSIALTENVTGKLNFYEATAFDSIGLTEEAESKFNFYKAIAYDNIGLTEEVTGRLSLYKALAYDTIGLTDGVTAERIIDLLEAIVYDSIGLSDNVAAGVTPLKAIAFDSIILTDNAAIPLVTLEAIVYDTIALTDASVPEILTFLQNIVSGEIEQFPQFRGNIQAWNVEIAKYVEKHLRQLKQDIETLYTKV